MIATDTGRPDVAKIGTMDEFGLIDALAVLGRLVYTDGGTWWEILDAEGNVIAEQVQSDRDAAWIARREWERTR